jgi:hypothetical protein
MRRFLPLLAGSLFLASGTLAAAPRLAPEAQLARALEGRIAGEPVDCIQLRNVRSSRIIDDTAILYDTGSTIYVNRPRGGAEALDQWDILVTKTHSSQLCSIDVVDLYDSGSRMRSGFVSLGEFVPYRKPRAGRLD